MSRPISLQEAERRVFQATFEDGLWDLFLGCFMLIFALAPLLSTSLGDFWSSMVFLPFWGLVALAIWLVRRRVVAPRAGVVKLGRARQAKLARFTLVMLVVNVAALVVSVFLVARAPQSGPGMALFLGLAGLIAFSLAAYLLGFRRLYGYGLLAWLAPLVGEWLYSSYGVPHHGLPVTFGIAAGVMIATGLVIFGRFLRDNPVVEADLPGEGA